MAERGGGGPRWVVRRAVKVALAGALLGAGAGRVVAAMRRRQAGGARVLVLSYHRATHDFAAAAASAIPSMLVSARTLRLQLEQVARTHELVSLADAVRILREPPGASRGNAVAVTFDDGYADNHAVALPVLSALRAPATVFVATGYVGTARRMPHDRIFATLSELARHGVPLAEAGLDREAQALLDPCIRATPALTLQELIARLPHDRLVAVAGALERRTGLSEADLPEGSRLLSWEELRALDAAGVEVAGHSVFHAVLPNLPLAEARREIDGCRDAIAERLGRPPRHFAYPNGYHSPAVRRAVADAGFEAAFTTEDRENVRGGDLQALRRKVLWENTTVGPAGYSSSVAACSFGGVFHALGLSRAVSGERSDGEGADAVDSDAASPGGHGVGAGSSGEPTRVPA